MTPSERLEAVCKEIAHLLEDLARGRAAGIISESTFVETVLQVEAQHVTPAGFTLTASNTIDDWTVFKIRQNGCSDACASFEFLPQTGEFRRPGSGPK